MKMLSISQDFFDLVDGDRKLMLKSTIAPASWWVRRLRSRKAQGLRRAAAFNILPQRAQKTNALHCRPAPYDAPPGCRRHPLHQDVPP